MKYRMHEQEVTIRATMHYAPPHGHGNHKLLNLENYNYF